MTGDNAVLGSSTANAPDLDWSQVSETVRMLNLAVAQIAMAMHEGEDSIGALSEAFTGMVGEVGAIAGVARDMGKGADLESGRADVLASCDRVQGSMQESIMAFQFYDRLSQRLDHVQHALDQLAGLVSDKSRLYNPAEWNGLQQGIRARYTMQEEQDMFEALLGGATIAEALEQVRDRLHDGDIDDIELF